jgi:bacterioferritin-associated ferredoxin
MVVCHCRAVNDATIRDEIEQGALTADEVAARCGAGSQCGGCRLVIDDLVDELLARHLDSSVAA